jgi:hypothetical protein
MVLLTSQFTKLYSHDLESKYFTNLFRLIRSVQCSHGLFLMIHCIRLLILSNPINWCISSLFIIIINMPSGTHILFPICFQLIHIICLMSCLISYLFNFLDIFIRVLFYLSIHLKMTRITD